MAIGWRCDGARHVHTLLALGPIGDHSDGQLLVWFAARDGERSELAFAALVERHGPMVLRTCRAVLRDAHDAHDAFQTTFLVLARRADSIWVGESLASWLHQVARRTALCARSTSARRRKHEGQAAALTPLIAPDDPPDDLGEILHSEIARLPERYRAAVVLCLLEGLTHDQAAHRLGCPVGTLQSRLARGRERLRSRLARRGLAPSIAPAGAMVPASLIASTARAATGFAAGQKTAGVVSASVLSLTRKVHNAMFLSKWKFVSVVVLGVGLGVSGVGVLAQQDHASQGDPVTVEDPEPGPVTRPVGERVTIMVETPDGLGGYVVKRRILSQLNKSGNVRVTIEEQGRVSSTESKFASINIKAKPESKEFDINLVTAESVTMTKNRPSTSPADVLHEVRPVGGINSNRDRTPSRATGSLLAPSSTKPTAPLDPTFASPPIRPASAPEDNEIDGPQPFDLPQPSSNGVRQAAPAGRADFVGSRPAPSRPAEPDVELGPQNRKPGLPLSAGPIDPAHHGDGVPATIPGPGPLRSPILFNPQDPTHWAQLAQERRMNEMERKLNLILDKLDGPKAEAK